MRHANVIDTNQPLPFSTEPMYDWHGSTATKGVSGNNLPNALLIRNYSNDDVRVLAEPWSSDPSILFAGYHAAVLAEVEDTSVLRIGNLGVNPHEPPMPRGVASELKQGDFSALAAAQWEQIQRLAVAHELHQESLAIGGASLGAHVVAHLVAQTPDDRYFSRIDLHEITGLDASQTYREFVLQYLKHGGDKAAEYFARNPEWVKKDNGVADFAKQALLRTRGLTVYPKAIYNSPSIEDLLQAGRQNGNVDSSTVITIAYGGESQVSPAEKNIELANKLDDKGLRVNLIEMEGGTHAFGESMPDIAALHKASRTLAR